MTDEKAREPEETYGAVPTVYARIIDLDREAFVLAEQADALVAEAARLRARADGLRADAAEYRTMVSRAPRTAVEGLGRRAPRIHGQPGEMWLLALNDTDQSVCMWREGHRQPDGSLTPGMWFREPLAEATRVADRTPMPMQEGVMERIQPPVRLTEEDRS